MKKSMITRRRFLKGSALGANISLSLPLLEIMFSSPKAFAASFLYSRFIAFYVPNGTWEPEWFPSSGTKDNFSLVGSALEPFETAGLKDEISLYKGMTNAGRFNGSGNSHMRAISAFLTGSAIPNDTVATHQISLDQKLADFHQSSAPTRIHSVQLAGNPELDKPNNSRYNNQLKNALSFDNNGAILDNKANLSDAFERLFTGGNSGEVISELDARKLSILDAVKDDANRLLQIAGQEDRIRLEQYFDGLRDIELEIQRSNEGEAQVCTAPSGFFPATSDSARNNEIGDHARAAAKLIAAAYQCDSTRVFTYMAGGEAAGCAYDDIGIGAHIHNSLSHNLNGSQSARDKYHQIDTFHSSLVANIMTELKNVATPEGTLLNDTCILYGSGMGNGDSHSLTDVALMVGGKFGNFETGKFHTLNGRNHNELLMSLHNEMGLPGNSFGDNTDGSTAPIS